jgi:membrane fusion protein (multidrug efflux system)
VSAERQKTATVGLSVVLTLLWALAGCETGNTYAPPPPPEVSVSLPVQRPVTEYSEFTGTTRAFETVDLRARVRGFLKKVNFVEASDVEAGQVLMVIDQEPFQVRVDAAKAKLDEAQASLAKAKQSKSREVARAQLALDQSSLSLAEIEERRNRALLSRNAASRDDVDKSEASTKKSAAQVEADKASLEQSIADFQTNILAAQANLESARADLNNAQIDLGYCTIVSPISGRITRKAVDVGNLVGDTDATVLATIVREDPIYAYMSVSEMELLRFREMVSKGERPDFRKETVALEMGLANETGFPHPGRLDYADPMVDPGTGTVQARGVFANEKRTIVAGLFVRIRTALQVHSHALLVPERAIALDQQGSYVLIVGSDDKVEQRHVTPGPVEGTLRVVSAGLKSDERVVIEGLQRARPGLVVKPVPIEAEPAVAPAPAAATATAPQSATAPGPPAKKAEPDPKPAPGSPKT